MTAKKTPVKTPAKKAAPVKKSSPKDWPGPDFKALGSQSIGRSFGIPKDSIEFENQVPYALLKKIVKEVLQENSEILSTQIPAPIVDPRPFATNPAPSLGSVNDMPTETSLDRRINSLSTVSVIRAENYYRLRNIYSRLSGQKTDDLAEIPKINLDTKMESLENQIEYNHYLNKMISELTERLAEYI